MVARRKAVRGASAPAPGSSLALFAAAMILAGLGQCLMLPAMGQRMPMLVAGWALVGLGAAALAWSRRRQPAVPGDAERGLPVWAEAAGLALILALALALRLAQLDVLPNAGFRDECESGNVAIQILNGDDVYDTGTSTPVYIEYIYQNAAGYFYPVAAFFKAFGISVKSVRLTSVFWGVASVGAFYFLARLLLGAPMALFLGLVLAGLRWHLNFSRIGFLGMMTVFLSLPMFYYLWRGLREPHSDALKRYPDRWLLGALALAWVRGYFAIANPWLSALATAVCVLPLVPFLYMGLKDRKSALLMGAAACLALSLYSYLAARLFIFIALGLMAYEYFRAPGALAKWRKPALIAAGALMLLGFWMVVEGSARRLPGLGWAGLAGMGLGGALAWLAALSAAGAWLKARGKALLTVLALLALAGLKVAFTDGSQLSPAKLWAGRVCLALGAGGMLAMAASLKDEARALLRPWLLAAAAFVLVASPLLNYALSNFDQMFTRASRVSIFNDRELEGDARPWGAKFKESVPNTLGMYNVRGDANPRHNLPNEIMLNPGLAAVFAVSVLFLLLRFWEPLPFFLLLWWQAVLLGGYFSQESPQAYRTITAIPAVLLIVGAGLKGGWQTAGRVWGGSARWVVGAAAALLLLVGGAYELRTYFVGHRNHSACWAEFSATEYLIGTELKSHPNTHGVFRADWSDSWTVSFTTYPERDYEPFDPSRHVPMRDMSAHRGKNILYVLDSAYRPLLPLLRAFYPNGVYREQIHPFTQEPIYWSFFVPASDAAKPLNLAGGLTGYYYKDTAPPAQQGDTSVMAAADHWRRQGMRFKRVDPFILFNWTVDPVQAPFSVEWRGKLRVRQAGRYTFVTHSNDYAELTIDGRKVLERPHFPANQFDAQGDITLSAGDHPIHLRYYEARNYSRMELLWQRPGQPAELVPTQALIPE